MSDDVAYPVFRTPDRALALSTARRLVEFGRREYSKVSVCAELRSAAEVLRVARELPEGLFRGREEYGEFDGVPAEEQPVLVMGVHGPGLPADPSAYEGRLPVECELRNLPVGSIEDAFAAAVGPNAGEIYWDDLYWPDAPAIGFHGESKHAEVTLLLNTARANSTSSPRTTPSASTFDAPASVAARCGSRTRTGSPSRWGSRSSGPPTCGEAGRPVLGGPVRRRPSPYPSDVCTIGAGRPRRCHRARRPPAHRTAPHRTVHTKVGRKAPYRRCSGSKVKPK